MTEIAHEVVGFCAPTNGVEILCDVERRDVADTLMFERRHDEAAEQELAALGTSVKAVTTP